MKRTTQTTLSWTTITLIVAFFTTSVLAAPLARSTLIYFVRHGEDTEELVGIQEDDGSLYAEILYTDCNVDTDCCVEALNQLGRTRAQLLADWFDANRITPTLTHVIASHKVRTRQTVQEIAARAGLTGDVDQEPGDGVINVPSTPAECEAPYHKAKSVIGPQTDYINSLPLGSKAVVCSHSPAIYPIMRNLGIDTSDPVKFPVKPDGKVKGFNNLWVVLLEPVEVNGTVLYQGRLLVHYVLDMGLSVSAFQLGVPGQ